MVITYRVIFSVDATDSLGKLDKYIAQRILDRIKWLSLNIDNVNHQSLTGHLRGAFKLRVGDYRVVYELNSLHAMLLVRFIGHRSEIYRR